MRKAIAAGALASVAALAAPAFGGDAEKSATSGGDAEKSANKDIRVDDNFFRPRRTTIRKGSTVTWKWRGERRHNVRFTGRRRPRGCRTQRNGSCRRRFRRAARYTYVCTLHGSMTARLRVVR